MESSLKKKKFQIGGMTCINCQNKIERKLRCTKGVEKFNTSYNTGKSEVIYKSEIISFEDIESIISSLDYVVISEEKLVHNNKTRTVGILIIIISLYFLLEQLGILNLLTPSQIANQNMGYGMIFVIGLLTSVHCVAMCGGINLSQCIPRFSDKNENPGLSNTIRPAFLYNLGRVISYTIVGFLVGGLGSVIIFSNTTQGVLKLIAGVFMVIMGINMLNIFPWLRRFNPRLPKFFVRHVNDKKADSNSPLYIGLLNGLMPCGPLQAMQIYALSTGSPISGAISMFLFSLGTVPLMFGLGAISSVLGRKFTRKIMTAGAVLVVVLGMTMLSQGMSLSGLGSFELAFVDKTSEQLPLEENIEIIDGVRIVNSTLLSNRYPEITVQAGVPVKWIIDAPEGNINGCNYKIFIPEYDIEHEFSPGENIMEFIPTKVGIFPYSCWMGMIRSKINVVSSDSEIPAEIETPEQGGIILIEDQPKPIEAGYVIPTDEVTVAVFSDGLQKVAIEIESDRFKPAIIIIERYVETEWKVINNTLLDNNFVMNIPKYQQSLTLTEGENFLYMLPMDDFDFSNGESTFFGYVKVVDDINGFDMEEIKDEISQFKTMIWTTESLDDNN